MLLACLLAGFATLPLLPSAVADMLAMPNIDNAPTARHNAQCGAIGALSGTESTPAPIARRRASRCYGRRASAYHARYARTYYPPS